MSASPAVLRFDDGGWTESVGGHLALDLVNTVSWRGDPTRTVDRVPDAPAVVRWAHWAGMLDDRQAVVFAREAAADAALGRQVTMRVKTGREVLHRIVRSLAAGVEPPDTDVTALQRWLVPALVRARAVAVMPLAWSTGLTSVTDLPDELALRAWRLLDREDVSRIRECRGDGCGWLFLDRSRNGSRIWCSSADCGNRTRVRRHYERHVRVGGSTSGGR